MHYRSGNQYTNSPWLASAALVCGVCGLKELWVGVIGLVLGIIAWRALVREEAGSATRNIAIAGMLLGVMSLLHIPIVWLLTLVFGRQEGKPRQPVCVHNQRQIAVAIQMYVQDHQGIYPSNATIWSDLALDPGVTRCPARQSAVNGYGYNAHMGGLLVDTVANPEATLLTADTSSPDNLIHGTADINFRHGKYYYVAYADGHIGYETEQPDEQALVPARKE